MKLKQRVIMMSSLFLTMATLFLIGIQLTWTLTDPQSQHPNQEKSNKSNEPIEKKLSPAVPSSNQPPSDAINRFRERFNNHKKPPPPLPVPHDEFMKDILQKRFGKFPHIGKPPLLDLTPVPFVKINPWSVWERWVTQDHFYPEGAFYSSEMNQILETLATSQVTELGLGYKGTQLKATMMLGGQKTVFKPKRWVRSEFGIYCNGTKIMLVFVDFCFKIWWCVFTDIAEMRWLKEIHTLALIDTTER